MPKASLVLTGQWEFKEYPLSARRMRDLDSADWLATTVPSSIFTSLLAAGKIEQADIDTNPENFSSVSEKPWIYRKFFDVPDELLTCDRIELVLEGIDTIANIWLNDKLIAKTNNMFLLFRFDVTGLLKPKNNSLLVKFEPAVQYAKKLMARYTNFSESDFRNPYRVYIRKAQYQFGWDFCPALPGCGIWRPVRIEGISKAALADVQIRTVDCNHHYADVKIAVKLDTVKKEEFFCRLTLSDNGRTIEQNLDFKPGEDFHSTVIRIDNPNLWWPCGYGRQNLCQLTLQLLSGNEIIDQVQKKFGIRTVRLNRNPDEYGEKFRFEINGQAVFAKGANWVPASIFAGSVTAEDYREILHKAAGANINMLRVWGGGYYESDEFYELCDRLGIMVWQDFMFACAYYPDQQWFLKEVKNEVTQIVKRLRNFACLVLWCGNNEIDWLHSTGRLGKGKKFYGKSIYHKILSQLLSELDPDRDYIPTTPAAAAKKPNNPDFGAFHQWDVWAFYEPVRKYISHPVPRFVTEFGLQSLPDMETIKNFCPPDHLHIASRVLEKHNYQLEGNSRLYLYMGDLFGIAGNIEQFVYLSQITQARAAKTYVEHLRAHNFRNSGVLFWQLNDCCPAITWSALDYTKKPKAIYYYAKRFFSKLLITVVPENDEPRADFPPTLRSLNVIVINDDIQTVTATLSCRLIDLFGNVLDQVSFPAAIGPLGTSPLLKLPKAIMSPTHPEKSALYLMMEKDGGKIAENLLFFLPDKYIEWPRVQITKRFSRTADRQWKLYLKSDALAKDVQISATVPANISDNFVDLLPPDDFEITIDCPQQVSSTEPVIQLRLLNDYFNNLLLRNPYQNPV